MLIFGWGNPGRGDDALGPALIERIGAAQPRHPEWEPLTLLTDFQLQPEHALDLDGHGRVLFVDASVSCAPPYVFDRLRPQPGFGYTTHAFELGQPICTAAQVHLAAAIAFVESFLAVEAG